MRRALLGTLLLAMTALPLSADGNCDREYVAFMDHVGRMPAATNGDHLANIHRKALRIFYACDSGHLQKPETFFRALQEDIAENL